MKTPYNPFDPGQHSLIKNLENFACILNLGIFGIFLFAQIFVLYKINLRTLDKTAILTLSLYSLSILARFSLWIQYVITG
jgi:hypothetical protein